MDRVGVDLGQRSKTMHITLWVVQVLLAVVFLMTGAMKAFMPLNEVAKTMRWVPDVPVGLVRFIGLAELAGALRSDPTVSDEDSTETDLFSGSRTRRCGAARRDLAFHSR